MYCVQLPLRSPERSCRATLRRMRCTALSTDFGGLPTVSAISLHE
ncbi:Maff2 family protein, partial [Dysosmobacter welbionis]